MKIIILLVLYVALGVSFFINDGWASCAMCDAGSAAVQNKDTGVVNDVCPVMGNKISKDTPHTVEYKGRKIGFCCDDCVRAFKADPEKYMSKIDIKNTNM